MQIKQIQKKSDYNAKISELENKISRINCGENKIPNVLKQVNAVVVATISIIHMQNCVFLMLLKILMLKLLI